MYYSFIIVCTKSYSYLLIWPRNYQFWSTCLNVTWRWGCGHRTTSAVCPWIHRALTVQLAETLLNMPIWKAIWVFIQHFPISGISSRYREFKFPISGNQFPISGNNRFPDIGKWISDIGNWFSDIGKCVWFPDIGKSIPDIRKSPDRSRSLRHPATPPYHTAPYQQRPQQYRPHRRPLRLQ